MELPDSPTRAEQKRHQSSEPSTDTERHGREYYLRPSLDSLKAAISPCQWMDYKDAVFEDSLAHVESLAAVVSFLIRSALTGVALFLW